MQLIYNKFLIILDKKLSKGWPEEGRIQFQNLYLLYTPNDAPVLKNLNFVIEHGQKVCNLRHT